MSLTPELIGALSGGIVAILGAITALVVAVARLSTKTTATLTRVDGRMDELLALTRTSAIAEGKLAGPDATTTDTAPRA